MLPDKAGEFPPPILETIEQEVSEIGPELHNLEQRPEDFMKQFE